MYGRFPLLHSRTCCASLCHCRRSPLAFRAPYETQRGAELMDSFRGTSERDLSGRGRRSLDTRPHGMTRLEHPERHRAAVDEDRNILVPAVWPGLTQPSKRIASIVIISPCTSPIRVYDDGGYGIRKTARGTPIGSSTISAP